MEFYIDTASPVTIITPVINSIETRKTTKCFVDVNKNPINFKGEALVEVTKIKEVLPMLITENTNTQPFKLAWTGSTNWKLGYKETTTRILSDISRPTKIINDYEDLFKNNHTIKDLTISMQLKSDSKPTQQKGRPVPIHFQKKPDKNRKNCLRKDIWKKQTKPPKPVLSHRPT